MGYAEQLEKYEKDVGKDGTFENATDLCNAFWAWRMVNWPELATFSGCYEFDDKLNDHSLQGFRKREEEGAIFKQHCEKLIQKGGLSEDELLNVQLLREDLKVYLEGAKAQGYLFPVSYMEGMQCDFEQLTTWMVFKTPEDFEKYICRLKALPERIQSDITVMKEGINLGKVHHILSMRGVLEGCDKLINVSHPEHTTLYDPFKSMSDSVPEEKQVELKQEAVETIEKTVIPAFNKLRIFIENDYMPKCREKEGISNIEGGEEFYKQCLKFHLSLDLTPQQVHDLGRKEVYRIRQAMDEVVKKTGFQGEFREFLHHLRTSQEFYYDSREELLDSFRNICSEKIRPKLSNLFPKIPETKLIIEAVPESRPEAPAAYYLSGTSDGKRPGKFYVNCNKLELCPKYEQMTLALHEGEPGHHFQGMYALETKDVPQFRQNMEDMYYSQVPSRFPMHTAFVEGWGLYSEYLGNELGLYDDDLYSLFGHLSFEMHRACRLVADTGLHHLGWSYEKTRLLFLENTALAEGFINQEVKRYITWPGQACAYKVGQMKIKQLRHKASDAFGDGFDIKEFHDVCLKCMMCPLNVLEVMVERYIKSKNAA